MTVAYAVSRADLVIIPTQGSQLDAKQATKAIKLIQQQERAFGKAAKRPAQEASFEGKTYC
jgi:chromosome partitioning protein